MKPKLAKMLVWLSAFLPCASALNGMELFEDFNHPGKPKTPSVEWNFFIDGVHQQTITRLVPTHPATLHVGMRHMGWTGKLDWQGTRTMLVDWIRISPLKGERPGKK